MLSCLYHKLSTQQWSGTVALTCVNSSANHRAISSEASGYALSAVVQGCKLGCWLLTLCSLGLKSMSSVSRTTLIVSTSSASLVRHAMSPRRAPDATEAGYSLAKLRRPRMAARRSSRRVALASRPDRVLIVSVAVCLAGACASSIRIILACDEGWRL
jgi:hypothetical protein